MLSYVSKMRRDGTWSVAGLSPFLSERARRRAPKILSYAAVSGAAMLISPRGEIALMEGAAPEVDVKRLARVAQTRCGSSVSMSFPWGKACVYAMPISMGWVLCVLSTTGVDPGQVVERLRRASAVLALALADATPIASGGASPPDSGAPAQAFLAPTSRKN